MTGRAKTVLLVPGGTEQSAVTTWILARAFDERPGERVRFSGPGTFDPRVQAHIRDVIVPLVDRILATLQQPQQDYELSVANVGAAATVDLGICVSGFSADVPVLLAMLSASLGLPIAQDLVATGHVASVDGDIAMVHGLPAKLAAAQADASVRRFVHPALDDDISLAALTPGQRQAAAEALRDADDRVRTIAVRDVAELLAAVFTDQDIVHAALSQGFFGVFAPPVPEHGPADSASHFLLAGNVQRFWSVLERHLLHGDGSAARRLLQAFVSFHADRSIYPAGFGRRLFDLGRSLPPAVRRLRRLFPLLPMPDCIRLSQYAREGDHDDVRLLIDATAGRLGKERAPAETSTPPRLGETADPGGAALDAIVTELGIETIATKIDQPLDLARATYRIDAVLVDSYDEYLDAVSSFYLHLVRHAQAVPPHVSSAAVREDALALLDRAFARSGGQKAARAEARDGFHGGVGFLFNAMTQQYKAEARAKHVLRVFKEALDPLAWDDRVALLAALLKRLEPHLPPNIRSEPPARFAQNCEVIVDAYVSSLDRLNTLLRSM